jgi:hypothetical protein
MALLTILFLIISCALSFVASFSTKSKQRQWSTIGFVVVIILFGLVALYSVIADINYNFWSSYVFFLAFGIVIPRLIANIINQNRLESPVLFIKEKSRPLAWALIFIFWLYLAVLVSQPHKLRDGIPIYDQEYFRDLIAFLFLLIPSLIYMLILMLQRTAFCKNGLFHTGLFTEWSDFKSYSWPQGEIYADPDVQAFVSKDTLVDLILEKRSTLFAKHIRMGIPLNEKGRIEILLSRKIKVE